jgi:hypothetical protein
MPKKHQLCNRAPRVFNDHRTSKGRAYRLEYDALRSRFPRLPQGASRWLKEAALLALDLDAATRELDRIEALRPSRPRLVAGARRARASLLRQLVAIEGRLKELQEPAREESPEEGVARLRAEIEARVAARRSPNPPPVDPQIEIDRQTPAGTAPDPVNSVGGSDAQ